MDRRAFLTLAGSGATLAVAGCLGWDDEPAGDHDVGMTIDSFRPEELTVEPGRTVEFVNTSSHAHTVTAFENGIPEAAEYWASGGFESEDAAEDAWHSTDQGGKLATNDSFEHTFEVRGEHHYYCIPHIEAEMVGTIRVEESA